MWEGRWILEGGGWDVVMRFGFWKENIKSVSYKTAVRSPLQHGQAWVTVERGLGNAGRDRCWAHEA